VKKLALTLSLLGALITLTACGNGPDTTRRVPTEDTGTTSYKDNGTVEGCRLIRVYPAHGEDFHLAICGTKATASSTQSCGKSCTRHVNVSTETEGNAQ
jgi:hypothetical protein